MHLQEIYAGLVLPETGVPTASGARRPYVAINMVSSLDGRAATPDGKTSGLGGPEDRAVMRSLRGRFDAVAVGTGTLRAERVSPNADPPGAAQPLPVVLTRTGDARLENLLDPARKPLVILPEHVSGAALCARAEVGRVGGNRGFLGEACELLFGERGVRTLLLEGGPTLNHAFLSENLCDELFLTLSPRLLGGPPHAPTILTGKPLPGPPGAELLSAYLASDRLFLRYALGAIRTR